MPWPTTSIPGASSLSPKFNRPLPLFRPPVRWQGTRSISLPFTIASPAQSPLGGLVGWDFGLMISSCSCLPSVPQPASPLSLRAFSLFPRVPDRHPMSESGRRVSVLGLQPPPKTVAWSSAACAPSPALLGQHAKAMSRWQLWRPASNGVYSPRLYSI